VASRRREYRTWEELSGSERRRGLVVVGAVGVVAVGAVVWIFGGTSTAAPAGAPAPVTALGQAPAAAGGLEAFYTATSGYRRDILAAETDVRTAIARNSGQALQPACALLATRAASASGPAVAVPDGDAGSAWTQGLRAFKQASQWCGELFDGTRIAVPVLLRNTGASLDSADAAWARLAPVSG
jgi:hypothetical protein